jgi:uncharacterized protein YndB with AHSA1/START domain
MEGDVVEQASTSREANAPREVCWAILTDPDRGADWLTFADEVRAEGDPGIGQVLVAKGALIGVPIHARSEVHRYDEPSAFGWRGEEPFPTSVVVELEDLEDGRTKLTTTLEADPGRFFPVGKKMAMRTIRKQFSRSADQLVELAEAEAG